MADEQILDAPEIGDQQGPNDPPVLKEEHRAKLDSIVQKMISNKESDSDIRAVVSDFKQKYSAPVEKPEMSMAPTKSPKVDGWNFANQVINGVNAMGQPGLGEDSHQQKVQEAKNVVHDTWNNIDETAKDHILNNRADAIAMQAQAPKSDNTLVSRNLPPILRDREENAIRNNIPAGEIDALKSNPLESRTLLHLAAQKMENNGNKEGANKLRSSVYALDSQDRAVGEKKKKIEENIDGIKNGDLIYNPKTQDLVKPAGIFESISKGHNDWYNSYKGGMSLAGMNKEDRIKYLNKETDKKDPDEPIPAPNSVGSMVGREGLTFAKGAVAASAAGFASENPLAAAGAYTAATSDDIGYRAYHDESVRTYAQVKNEMKTAHPEMSNEEIENVAADKADHAGKIAAASGMATNAAMSVTGTRLGGELNAAKSGFSSKVLDAADKAGQGYISSLKKKLPEAFANSGIAGASELAKNVDINNSGVKRDVMEGVPEAAGQMMLLHHVLGAAMHATGKAKSIIVQGLAKKPPEVVGSAINELVESGVATPGEAKSISSEIANHTVKDAQIPETVTDDNARLQIKGNMDKISDINQKLSKPEEGGLHESFHGPLKNVKERLEWENNMLAANPEDQIKILKDKQVELQTKLDDHNEAKRSGQPGKLEFPDSDRAQLSMVKDKIEEIQEKENPKKSKVSVILPEANKSVDAITIKPESNDAKEVEGDTGGTQSLSPENNPVGNDAGTVGEPSGGGLDVGHSGQEQPPIEPPTAKTAAIHVEHPPTEISKRGLQDVANEFGFDDIKSRDKKTDNQLRKDATNTIKEWADKGVYNKRIEELIAHGEKKGVLTDEERVILENHLESLRHDIRKLDPRSLEYDQKLEGIERVVKAGDATRSAAGAALRLPTGNKLAPRSLEDFFMEEKENSGVAKLTDKQKETVIKEHSDIETASKRLEEKVKQLEEQNAKLQAEKVVKSAKPSKGAKKTHENLAEERKQILADAREKLRKARGDSNVTILPYAKELIAIAPEVGKMVRNLVEEGALTLEEVAKKIHGEFKQDIPELTIKDVHDLVAGNYNEKKTSTRNEIAEKIFNLKKEAKTLSRLAELKDKPEPKAESAKIKRNKDISDIETKVGKEPDLKARQTRLNNEIKNLQGKIDNADYAKEPPRKPIKLDKETQTLKDQRDNLVRERELRLLKQQYKNESGLKKAGRVGAEVLNAPRTLMSSMDLSAPGRQGLVASVAHPVIASKAFVKMLQAAKSEKVFNRWFSDLKESPEYPAMQQSKLAISDPTDPKLSAREEAFMSHMLEKIPVIGQFIKGSERAYVIYLNKMRADIFKQGLEAFEATGRTAENSPELYKALASHINNMTGRGDISGKLEKAAPVLNSIFFSPRLIASRLNMLTNWANPKFYKNVPAGVRKMYFADMAKFIGFGTSILGLSAMAGGGVETDPRSSDFLKIKIGDTRLDVLGGFQQYLRTLGQMGFAETKSTKTGAINELDGKGMHGNRLTPAGRLARGKLSPVASLALDMGSGQTMMGDKILYQWGGSGEKQLDLKDIAARNFLPLVRQDLNTAMGEPDFKTFALLTASLLGFGVQKYQDEGGGSGGGGGATGSFRKPRTARQPRAPRAKQD